MVEVNSDSRPLLAREDMTKVLTHPGAADIHAVREAILLRQAVDIRVNKMRPKLTQALCQSRKKSFQT